jgi:hypothetical protein
MFLREGEAKMALSGSIRFKRSMWIVAAIVVAAVLVTLQLTTHVFIPASGTTDGAGKQAPPTQEPPVAERLPGDVPAGVVAAPARKPSVAESERDVVARRDALKASAVKLTPGTGDAPVVGHTPMSPAERERIIGTRETK